MKYILIFLLILSFIGPSADKGDSIPSVVRKGVYNYITCLDRSFDYLVDNVPAISNLAEVPYKRTYKKVMKDRYFTKHLISPNETLDEIIKSYNSDIDDIDDFRKVIVKENPGIVSESYEIKSGEYVVIPTK